MLDSKSSTTQDPKVFRQKRALHTRFELVRSARVIFARDGFQQARIEDIALEAGKTRGAFYANFDDKEDVFCAIFEENLSIDMSQLSPLLSSLPSTEQRIHALCDYLVSLSRDRERTLLNLEFKLYAIRHPQRQKRLADLYRSMCMRSSVPELTTLLPQLGNYGSASQTIDTLAISGIIDGFALNYLFDPELLCDGELSRCMRLSLIELLTGTSTLAT